MMNPLKLAQYLIGNSIEIHSVNFFIDFVHVDFRIDGIEHVFTSDGSNLEEALDAALNLKTNVETKKVLANLTN